MSRSHRITSAAAAAMVAAALVATPVAAAFSAQIVIRTAAAGRVPQVTDVAAAGARVVVGWIEDDAPAEGADPRAWIRASDDGGQTFGAASKIETDDARELHLAICGGRYLYAVYAVDLRSPITPHKWSIISYERDLVTGAHWSEQISFSNGTARYPDVACGSERVWIAWDDKEPGDPRHLFLTHSLIGPPADHDWVLPALDLGPAAGSATGPTVAAVTGHAYVSWIANAGDLVIRLKRYTVGGAPGYAVAGLPIKTFAAPGDMVLQLLAASGSRVALCYGISGYGYGMYVRVSDDHAATFGGSVELAVPAELGGIPESLAMRGKHVLVEAAIYWEGQSDTYRYRSTNAGGTFKRTMLGNNRGNRIGALKGSGANPKVVEAWDSWLYNGRKLRFHREL